MIVSGGKTKPQIPNVEFDIMYFQWQVPHFIMMESKVKGKEMKVGEKIFCQHLVGFEPTYAPEAGTQPLRYNHGLCLSLPFSSHPWH